MTKQIVLKLLREHTEEFLSGEAISRQAGVSRAAVWKAVEQLRQEGYGIESVPNRGYRLTRVTARLRPEELAEQFRDCRIGRELLCFDTIDSTNNELKRRAVSGTVDGTVILADQQTGGRGRRGRSFVSPAGKGLYLSAALRPRCPLSEISTLTAWTAVALCDAVEAACGVRPGIKWPNDIVVDGKKVCGILTEMSMEQAYIHHIVIGVGINVRRQEFPKEIRDRAAAIEEQCGFRISRSQLIADIMEAFEEDYEIFLQTHDLKGLRDSYAKLLVNRDREVCVLDPKGEFRGTARGINDQGELLVERQDGSIEEVYAGEVSVRGVYAVSYTHLRAHET